MWLIIEVVEHLDSTVPGYEAGCVCGMVAEQPYLACWQGVTFEWRSSSISGRSYQSQFLL